MSETRTSAELPMIGQRLLHYDIVEKLGEGGMGVVYKARDTHLDRFVAIKVLPADKVADADRKARFVREAKSASSLNHPSIVHVYDIAEQDGVDFIVMEYVPGKTLDEVIPRKGMRVNAALKPAIEIADALAAAHAAGIVHRDLKPGNVMVGEDGRVHVLDFGLAKLTEELPTEDEATRSAKPSTDEGTILGTTAYMSPEQAAGKKVDARSDVFSFGALLYEMVAGRRAFSGNSQLDVLAAIVKDDPAPLSEEVPHDLQKLIARCLRKDPERRFQFMKDVRVELSELKEESDSGRLAAVRPAEPTRSRRWPRWVLAAVGAGAILGAATWFAARQHPPAPSPLRIVNLTSYPGSESAPALSPDGTRVAFVWDGEKEDNIDVYVQMVGDTEAQRRTTAPERDLDPCWSPDGRQLAFMRWSADSKTGSLYLISAVAGGEHKVADLPNPGRGLSWTSDGAFIVVSRTRAVDASTADGAGLYRVSAADGTAEPLTTPAAPATDTWPRVSWDGRTLAFARNAYPGISSDLFLLPLTPDGKAEGSPQRRTTTGMLISGLAWQRDGSSIIVAVWPAFELTYLYRVFIDGHTPPERLEVGGHHEYQPSASSSSDRLAFTHADLSTDVWRLHVGGKAEPLFRSSFASYTPEFSPDGRKVAFTSNRNEQSTEIWVANADGSDASQLTHGPGRNQGSAKWSPKDGRWMAFDSQAADGQFDIYVIESSGGQARQITSEPSNQNTPNWSRDGQWIYYRSDRTGRGEIWRTRFSGGQPEQVTTEGAEMAYESPDGKTLFYTTRAGEVRARAVEGGPSRRLVVGVSVLSNSVAITKDGFYYMGARGADRLWPLSFYDQASGKSREVARLADVYQARISASPDGRDVLYAADAAGTRVDLKLIENFR
jgi:eukaryotic-like serine/threonine-protein kinase